MNWKLPIFKRKSESKFFNSILTDSLQSRHKFDPNI